MFRYLKKDESIVGKTIHGVSKLREYEDQFVMSFTDETFVIFRSQSGYDGDTNLKQEEAPSLRELHTTYNQKPFVDAGVATYEELDRVYDEIKAAEKIEDDRRREARERSELATLKRKYEGSP
jgi:hypothetical protein